MVQVHLGKYRLKLLKLLFPEVYQLLNELARMRREAHNG